MKTEDADQFLSEVVRLVPLLRGVACAVSGDAARCLWLLHTIPGSRELWKRICHTFPPSIDIVGANEVALPEGMRRDASAVAREFETAMVRDSDWIDVEGLAIPLVNAAYVLATALLQADIVAVPQTADLLRGLEAAGRVVDLEHVRAVLKAIRAGDRYETLQSISNVV